jgi:integrase
MSSDHHSRQKGVVVERKLAGGRRRFALRFHAYGQRRYLTLPDGTTRAEADRQLRHVLADVERGVWQPAADPDPTPAAPATEPTFHRFASDWYQANAGGWRESTRLDYLWQLEAHLLPFFQDHPLSAITVAEVDRYRTHKVTEGQIGAASINKTLTRLGQVLELAVERDLIARNPLRVNPRNRKLRTTRPRPVWLDRADQIEALLAAAGELDRRARPDQRHIARRAMLSTLVFSGMRIGELLSLRWRHVDLAHGRLYIGESKTDAGVRHVELLPGLREVLATYRAGCQRTGPDELVFPTSNGRRLSRDNVRVRVFDRAVALANERRAAADLTPLPEGLTLHKLRHTCCALLFACGWELPRVMDTLGHADTSVTLRLYAHVMATDPAERDRLRALVDGAELALETGTGPISGPDEALTVAGAGPENTPVAGDSEDGHGWARTSDLSRVKRALSH